MATLARVIIAAIIGPGVGAVVGQDIARIMAYRVGLEAGVVARWEMSGLLVGLLLGGLYLVLAVRCVVGFNGRLRSRVADPALLSAGALAALALAAGQSGAPAGLLAAMRRTADAVWVLGLLLLLTSLRYRPPVAVPEAAPAPEDWPEVELQPGEAKPQDAVDDETWRRYVSEEIRDD